MSWLMAVMLVLLVCSAIWTVCTPTLLLSAIGLAATSLVLAIVMYELGSPLAAVFELSVCAGLITVVFVSAISLTKRYTVLEERAIAAERIKRFAWLPLLVAVLAASWFWWNPAVNMPIASPVPSPLGVRQVLWGERQFDLLGTLLLMLVGVFGVVVLFKGWDLKRSNKR